MRTLLTAASILVLAIACTQEEEPVANRFDRTNAEIENRAKSLEAEVENQVEAVEERMQNEIDALGNRAEDNEAEAANSAR